MSATGTVYAIRAGDGPYVKIGYAADLRDRVRRLQTGCPEDMRVVWSAPGSLRDEKHLHAQFAGRRRRGEWFDFAEMSDVEIDAALGSEHTAPHPVARRTPAARSVSRSLRNLPEPDTFLYPNEPGLDPIPIWVNDRAAFWRWIERLAPRTPEEAAAINFDYERFVLGLG